jgi:hypothetical protein
LGRSPVRDTVVTSGRLNASACTSQVCSLALTVDLPRGGIEWSVTTVNDCGAGPTPATGLFNVNPPCGDGTCAANETLASCPQDCHCGNGICDAALGEVSINCPQDCHCGDGVCDHTETNISCSSDCYCGNGVCEPWAGESCSYVGGGKAAPLCPLDCPNLGCGD